jgi:hypothetical protein
MQQTILVKSKHLVGGMMMLMLSAGTMQATGNTGWFKEPIKDSIIITRNQSNKKYQVKFYPSAKQEALFFSASGEEGKVYQIYLFTMENTLVKQTQIRNRETTIIQKPAKGSYLFEVFSDDERIESGSLIVQ